MHNQNCFITLTYDNEHLPLDNSLDRRHFTLFAKRMRKRLGSYRYFMCGEYGDENDRPHYHAAIFGIDFAHDRYLHETTRAGHKLYRSPTLEALWPMGFCTIGELTHDSAAYVARYVMKKVNGPRQDLHYVDHHTGAIREPEYTTMSRRPGIGSTWFEKYHRDVYPSDEVISKGYPARPPAYYDSLLERRDPELRQEIREKRSALGKSLEADNTPSRLKIREEVLAHKQRLTPRKI